jgi:hypothetical protein
MKRRIPTTILRRSGRAPRAAGNEIEAETETETETETGTVTETIITEK